MAAHHRFPRDGAHLVLALLAAVAITLPNACGGRALDISGQADAAAGIPQDAANAPAPDQQAPVEQGDSGVSGSGVPASSGAEDGGHGESDAPWGDGSPATPDSDGSSKAPDSDVSCGDLFSDTHNCGACGHDCQGGACTDGVCQPVVIYAGVIGSSEMSYPWGLAVDDTNVYWSDNMQGQIWVAPKSGAVPSVLATDTRPSEVAVDATSIYWTDQGGLVLKARLQGGSPMTLASSSSETAGIAVDSYAVYFTTADNFNGVVNEVSLDGTTQQTLASGQGDPLSLAIYGSTVFWSNDEPFFNSSAQQQGDVIASVPVDGGSVVTISSGQQGALQVAVDSTSVYWTTGVALMKSSWDGGAPNTLGSGCSAIAVDRTGVYCATGTLITRVPLSGGMPTTIADFTSFAYGYTIPARKIVLDETTVYWVVPFDALVMKVAK